MNEVIYRELKIEDYQTVKKLIGDAFGLNNIFKKELQNDTLSDVVLGTYLQHCLEDSTFSKVAVKDDKVIGVILGEAFGEKKLYDCNIEDLFIYHDKLDSLKSDERLIKVENEFIRIANTYDEFINGMEKEFDGCIHLFIVDKDSRGLGVGKALVKYLSHYMISHRVKSLYLFTDNRCNYGFYDNQGFKRVKEKSLFMEGLNDYLDIFLYRYDF